jgi:hypothetical protein
MDRSRPGRLTILLCTIALTGSPATVAAGSATVAADPQAIATLDQALGQARAEYVLRQYDAALRKYRNILKVEAAAPGIPIRDRTRAYIGILELAPKLEGPDPFTTGNMAAKAMVREEAAALGADSSERTPGLLAAANWFARTGQPTDERKQLEELVRVTELSLGARHASLAVPLVRVARTYILYGEKPAVAKATLDRALGLEFDGAPDHRALQSAVHAALGDHAVVFAEAGASTAHYEAAWQALASATADGDQAAAAEFALPVPLRINIPAEPFVQAKGSSFFGEGEVVFTFTVRPDGHVADVAILRKDLPIASLPTPVLKAFMQARYRPQMADGHPVATVDQQYRIIFR